MTAGECGSGKTSLIHRFVNETPLEDIKSTIGVEFSTKHFVKEDGKIVRAQIWDTIGSEKYRAITSSYFRGAVAAFVIYDISSFASFKQVSNWLKQIKQHCNENLVIMLVGNKCDLEETR